MAERTCISCPNSAGEKGIMPFGWDIAPLYLRLKGKKEHVRTVYKCSSCVERDGLITPAEIAEMEAEIRKNYVAKPKKGRGRR